MRRVAGEDGTGAPSDGGLAERSQTGAVLHREVGRGYLPLGGADGAFKAVAEPGVAAISASPFAARVFGPTIGAAWRTAAGLTGTRHAWGGVGAVAIG